MMRRTIKAMKRCFGMGLFGLCLSTSINAATPLWTYSAPNPASVTIADGGTEAVSYTVTNQSTKAKNLLLQSTPGLSASTCYLAGKGSTCTLTLTINGSKVPQQGIHAGPFLCELSNPNQCYQPSPANVLNVAKVNQANISATPTAFSIAQGGASQLVTISNNGPDEAYGVGIVSAPGLGVSVSGACASPMSPNDTCQLTFTSDTNTGTTTAVIAGSNTNNITENITVTAASNTTLTVTAVTSPAIIAVGGSGVQLSIENTGSTTAYNVVYTLPGWNGVSASSSCGDIAPGAANACSLTFNATYPNVTNTIGFRADNASIVQSPPIAFSYQGYLVFSTTGGSSGTAYVVDTNDDGSGVAWDSSNCNIGGGTSTCVKTNATSLANGQYTSSPLGNTYCIITGGCGGTSIGAQAPVNAAGVCYNITTSSGNVVSQGTWYLPSICELSGNAVTGNFCSPGTTSMYGSLFLKGFGGFTNNSYYWSSTEYSGATVPFICPSAGACAWEVFFRVSPVGPQSQFYKSYTGRVRCAQAISY